MSLTNYAAASTHWPSTSVRCCLILTYHHSLGHTNIVVVTLIVFPALVFLISFPHFSALLGADVRQKHEIDLLVLGYRAQLGHYDDGFWTYSVLHKSTGWASFQGFLPAHYNVFVLGNNCLRCFEICYGKLSQRNKRTQYMQRSESSWGSLVFY